jgi:hypothetical protein
MAKDSSGGGGKVRATFQGQTPDRYRLAGNNPAVLAQLAAIDSRAADVNLKARSHFWKYEETWVVREAIGLWRSRSGLPSHMDSLPTAAREYTQASLMTEARRNVRARMTNRLTKINGIRTRMTNAVIRNLQHQSPQLNPTMTPGKSPTRGPKR